MIDKIVILEDVAPAVFYGARNCYLQMIRSLYPKLRIVARDNVMKVLGDEEQVAHFEETIVKLQALCLKYNSLSEEMIIDTVKGKTTAGNSKKGDNAICYNVSGKPIKARNENQQRLVDAFEKDDMIFATGPAGTGKTYTCIALAVKALKEKRVRKIILSRPAVEAGEKLGFLPGDMKEKIDPYLQPLYDALEDMIPTQKLQEMIEKHVIQIAPLAFMRGRTLSDAVVILDEAQNTTTAQIKMFLTRMGSNTKMMITGDCTQIDLPRSVRSGLLQALDVLSDVKGISFVEMQQKDIVRHKLVTRIVEAYDKHNNPSSDSEAGDAPTCSGTNENTTKTKIDNN